MSRRMTGMTAFLVWVFIDSMASSLTGPNIPAGEKGIRINLICLWNIKIRQPEKKTHIYMPIQAWNYVYSFKKTCQRNGSTEKGWIHFVYSSRLEAEWLKLTVFYTNGDISIKLYVIP